MSEKFLRSPDVLPQVTALYGIPVEMGADNTRHWWHEGVVDGGVGWSSAAAGALPAQAYPELEGLPQLRYTTARQYVEHTLGPTPVLELGMRPDALAQHTKPGWAPGTFTDGALQGHVRWAPWLGTKHTTCLAQTLGREA